MCCLLVCLSDSFHFHPSTGRSGINIMMDRVLSPISPVFPFQVFFSDETESAASVNTCSSTLEGED